LVRNSYLFFIFVNNTNDAFGYLYFNIILESDH